MTDGGGGGVMMDSPEGQKPLTTNEAHMETSGGTHD